MDQIRSQKIYKIVWAGDDPIVAQMDTDGSVETNQLYRHYDLVGSTNIVTDVQGRGFQRHEFMPSGEIWIDDRKEERGPAWPSRSVRSRPTPWGVGRDHRAG